jgi:mannose-1-phosphate guanylyltransferase
VVLAGGIGSRFWPLSTPSRPKQLLPLVSPRPLIRDSVSRLLPIVDADHILILTNASLVDAIAEILPDIPRDNIIAEPRPAGTAAALTWAAIEIERRDPSDPTMMSIHADWAIADEQGFRDVLLRAEQIAVRQRALVTVGVVPDRPETGYGYIQPAPGDPAGGVPVARFVEKPDRASAGKFIAAGYLWNSGIFVWRTADFLGEVAALTPEISGALKAAATSGLDKFFSSVRSVSVDNGVLERSRKVMTLAADFGWDDIGTWPALLRSRELDSAGNSASGSVHLVDARDNVVHADNGSVVLYGVSDLVVVSRDGVTLITTTEKAADLKALVDALPPELREPK